MAAIELWAGGRWRAAPSGRFVLVDDADLPLVRDHRWYGLCPRPGADHYAATKIKGRTVLMHRLLLGEPAGLEIDHISGDRMDNRRANLRACTRAENHRNTRKPRHYMGRPTFSRFKGVRRVDGSKRFGASLYFREGGALRSIRAPGTFATEEEAARAYDELAARTFGEFARLNFPRRASA